MSHGYFVPPSEETHSALEIDLSLSLVSSWISTSSSDPSMNLTSVSRTKSPPCVNGKKYTENVPLRPCLELTINYAPVSPTPTVWIETISEVPIQNLTPSNTVYDNCGLKIVDIVENGESESSSKNRAK